MSKTIRECTPEKVERFEAAMERIKNVFGVRTQVQLAELIGVRQSSISDAKRRCSIPSDWLLTIWNKTGHSPTWIMEGDACGHRFAVASTAPGEMVNAVEVREQIEVDVRAEVDNLPMHELIKRLRVYLPEIEFRIPPVGSPCEAGGFEPLGDLIPRSGVTVRG